MIRISERAARMGRTGLAILMALALFVTAREAFAQQRDAWKEWLQEVDPIMTSAERSVFRNLKTEEDRARFTDSFWKVRNPDPKSPQNKFKMDYYQRLDFVKKNLRGPRSDRGRVYLILGPPVERKTYLGEERVVDSELWTYYGDDRNGLPPVMNLIFFRRGNVGELRLFYPGINTALDVLSPAYADEATNAVAAFEEIRKSALELADATLSVIPGEGVPGAPAIATLSSRVFAQIWTLPEREFSGAYLRNFRSVEGVVDVTPSTQEMPGSVMTALSRDRGFTFLNYAVAPEAVHLVRMAEGRYTADLLLNLKIEDRGGRTICQQEKNVVFRLTEIDKKTLEAKKIMFTGFLPVIPGAFRVKIILTNGTTQEFLIGEEDLEVGAGTVPVLLGYKIGPIRNDRFIPFSAGQLRLSVDPRSVFDKSGSLEGIAFVDTRPVVRLAPADDPAAGFEITDVEQSGDHFLFSQPLAGCKAGYYDLTLTIGSWVAWKKAIAILDRPVVIPEAYEWTDPPGSGPAYEREIGIQYLNQGDITAAIRTFEDLPKALWDARSKPIIARAYYRAEDYQKALDLLEDPAVIKDYTALYLLGNSALHLKQLRKAADYLERLRAYGDTVKVNQALGAIFLSLGERDKAKVYFDRAGSLEKKASGPEKEGLL